MSAQNVPSNIINSVPTPYSASEPPRLRSQGSETVKVYFGTDLPPGEVMLNKDLVCAASKIFQVALQKSSANGAGFAESQTNEMRFPEESGQVMGALMDWLNDLFPGTSASVGKLTMLERKEGWDKYWFEAFLFADRIMAPGLQLYAWEQIKRIFHANEPVKPSYEMSCALFIDTREMPECASAVREWVVVHVLHWQPEYKNRAKLEDWMSCSQGHIDSTDPETAERLRHMRNMLDLVSRLLPAAIQISWNHPSTIPDFERKHGFNVVELRKEARQFDGQKLN